MPKFESGEVCITNGIADMIATDAGFAQFVQDSVSRHLSGDWGVVNQDDTEANNDALTEGDRILSAYVRNDIKIWIITEGDRSSTCVMKPEEY